MKYGLIKKLYFCSEILKHLVDILIYKAKDFILAYIYDFLSIFNSLLQSLISIHAQEKN